MAQRFVRVTAVALILYGLLGFGVGAAIVVIARTTFAEIGQLSLVLDQELDALVETLGTVSRTMGDAAVVTDDLEGTVAGARASAETASQLATESAQTFDLLAQNMQIQVFGFQPFATIAPQFTQSAEQLRQLGATLTATSNTLQETNVGISRVGEDLELLRVQVSNLATAVDRVPVLATTSQQFRLLQLVIYGTCALFVMQSLFSLIAGVALFRLEGTLHTLRQVARHHRHTLAREAIELAESLDRNGTESSGIVPPSRV